MKKIRSYIFVIITTLLTVPLSLFAADPPTGIPVKLINPLRDDLGTIDALLLAILNLIMVLMVPIIVFFIIFAGFKYVTARGNPSTIGEATKALTYAIIGAVIILGAVAISQMIKSTVDQFSSNPAVTLEITGLYIS